jgi:hypothetical protein
MGIRDLAWRMAMLNRMTVNELHRFPGHGAYVLDDGSHMSDEKVNEERANFEAMAKSFLASKGQA